jgi:hypothetical protein
MRFREPCKGEYKVMDDQTKVKRIHKALQNESVKE